MVYRALDHRKMKTNCEEIAKTTVKPAVREALGRQSISAELKAFAMIFVPMQQLRHLADYHPTVTLSRSDVADLIDETDRVLHDFGLIPADELTDIVTYMLVGSRTF